MKKLLIALGIMSAFLLFAPAVHAEDVFNDVCTTTPDAALCKDKATNNVTDGPLVGPNGIITKATQIIVIFTGVAAVIMIMIGGIRFVISGGDPAKVNSAKNAIIFALVGVVVAAVAQVIVSFVFSRL